MDASHAQLLINLPCHTGEGPLWHDDLRRLFFVDIPAGKLYRYDPRDGRYDEVMDDRPIGGYAVQADGNLLAFRDRGNVVVIDPESGEVLDTVIEQIDADVDTRFNDVFADPIGGVFCGTIRNDKTDGRFYRLAPDGHLELISAGVGCSNGMGLSLDHQTFYYIDTPTQRVDRFAFDPDTGAVRGREPFIDTNALTGAPDGMTVDSRGHLFVAFWGGGCVREFDPQGEFVREVAVPSPNVTSLCFGPTEAGGAYDTAFVTTATGGKGRDAAFPQAGSLFALDLETTGSPEYRSRVGC